MSGSRPVPAAAIAPRLASAAVEAGRLAAVFAVTLLVALLMVSGAEKVAGSSERRDAPVSPLPHGLDLRQARPLGVGGPGPPSPRDCRKRTPAAADVC